MKQNIWMLSSLFANACITGLSTLLPVYLIFLNGTVLDVAFAISLFNLASIISAIFWGYFVDAFCLRKRLIIVSYIGLTLGGLGLYFVKNLVFIGFIYCFIGFMRSGSQPAIHILIMETNEKKDWGTVFARIQVFSVIGMIIATLLGAFWIVLFGIESYLLACFCYGILAILITIFFISEPKMKFEIEIISRFPLSLIQRIRSNPVVLPKLPSFKEIDTLFKMLKINILQGFPLFLLSTFFFYSATGLYFTSIIPFMKANMISDFLIFIVHSVLYLTQAIAFVFSSRFVNIYGEKFSTIFSFFPRIFGTTLTIFAATFLSSIGLLFYIVISFVALDLAFSIFITSTSLILFKLLPIKRRGYYLGIFGSLTGLGLLFGSLISGEISTYLGFPITFTIAATFLIVSYLLMRVFNKRTEINT